MFNLTLLTLKIEYVVKIINMINEVYVLIKKNKITNIIYLFCIKHSLSCNNTQRKILYLDNLTKICFTKQKE